MRSPEETGMSRVICVLGLILAVGCQSTDRERLEEERRGLMMQRDSLRGSLNGLGQAGSRWDSHPETHQLTDDLSRISARINEIDRELMEP